MQKYNLTACIFFALFVLLSCGPKKSRDIDVSKIQNACDCLNASQIILNELLDFKAEFLSVESQLMQLTGDITKERELDQKIELISKGISPVIDKFFEIMEVCEKIPQPEYENCDLNLEQLQEQFKEVEVFFVNVN